MRNVLCILRERILPLSVGRMSFLFFVALLLPFLDLEGACLIWLGPACSIGSSSPQ